MPAKTKIPKHADLTDVDEAAWWDRWALVGDAKDAYTAANEVWFEALDAYKACRVAYRLANGSAAPSASCGCEGNTCLEAAQDAKDARETTVAAIAAAEQNFKDG